MHDFSFESDSGQVFVRFEGPTSTEVHTPSAEVHTATHQEIGEIDGAKEVIGIAIAGSIMIGPIALWVILEYAKNKNARNKQDCDTIPTNE